MLPPIPTPRLFAHGVGAVALGSLVRLSGDEESFMAARPLIRHLEDGGRRVVPAAPEEADIRIVRDEADTGEAFSIDIAPDTGILLRGGTAGIRHAAQTVRALLPSTSFRHGAPATGITLPSVRIEDAPAHSWRGLMIDVSRHMMPFRWLLRLIEVMAFHKLNVLHLHLTDDQGWRMPVEAFPRLTEVGAYRRETLVGGRYSDHYDGTPYGGFYTKEELRELVAFATQHGITVVPEIDMPGHMLAAIASYPAWGNTGKQLEVLTRWALAHNVMNIEESTLRDMETILDEVMDVFGSPWIHLGGDECPRAEWRESARVAELMRERGIDDLDGVQTWIMRRLAAHVASRGRTALCWDEALSAGLGRDVGIMAWRDEEKAVDALRAGHPTIVSDQQFLYFDFKQSFDPAEPLGPDADEFFMTTWEQVHAYRPLQGLDGPAPLGVQAQLWTEFVDSPEKAEYQLFPRLTAFAELAWTGGSPDGEEAFRARLTEQFRRYEAMGIHYRPLSAPGPRWSSVWTGPAAEISATIAVSDEDIDDAPRS